jgi:hypothetical protein
MGDIKMVLRVRSRRMRVNHSLPDQIVEANHMFPADWTPGIQQSGHTHPLKLQAGVGVLSQMTFNDFPVLGMRENQNIVLLTEVVCPVPGKPRLRAQSRAACVADEQYS